MAYAARGFTLSGKRYEPGDEVSAEDVGGEAQLQRLLDTGRASDEQSTQPYTDEDIKEGQRQVTEQAEQEDRERIEQARAERQDRVQQELQARRDAAETKPAAKPAEPQEESPTQ